jgi:glycosyltransferase involved in cell wall biosynthesis
MKIIVIGTGQLGGIDSVIKNISINASQINSFKRYQSHTGKSKLIDIISALKCLLVVLYYSIFENNIIFHLHMSYKGSFWRKYIYWKLASFFNKRVIIHLHGSEFKVFYEKQNKIVKNLISELIVNCDCFIVLSRTWKDYIESILSVTTDNIHVVENFAIVVQPDVMEKKRENEFLFLGALIERKGIFDLIRVIKDIPNIILHVAGGGDERYFWSQVDLYGVRNKIIYHGWVDKFEKANLMKRCSAMVLPSYNEGLPVVILEAMASELLVISTPVGGIPEIVIDGVSGYIVEPGDFESIRMAINNVTDNECNKIIVEKAKEIYELQFSVEVIVPKIEKLYHS